MTTYPSQSDSPLAYKQATTLAGRYKDAYAVARTAIAFGGIIKGIAIAYGILVIMVVGGILFFSSTPELQRAIPAAALPQMVIVLFSLLLWGLFMATLLYLFGVIVSALGQNLLAGLDVAVNTSPFLHNDDKARIMSIS